ncbi:MAG: GNAT family N-acyltransferase [Pseudomonadota bacterium]
MQTNDRGAYRVLVGQGGEVQRKALALRSAMFRNGADDQDGFDDSCTHCVLERVSDARVVATFRMLLLKNGFDVDQSYAAQFYDLGNFGAISGKLLEIGRFCADPDLQDPEAIRLTWTAITDMALKHEVQLLFGCSSFHTTEPRRISAALRFLADGYLAPSDLAPAERFEETAKLNGFPPHAHRRDALAQIPPLLKTYLKMGAWVSDHAVIDRDLGTIHVLTGLETSKIPKARVASLKRDAG